jgi:hypothetical protein
MQCLFELSLIPLCASSEPTLVLLSFFPSIVIQADLTS